MTTLTLSRRLWLRWDARLSDLSDRWYALRHPRVWVLHISDRHGDDISLWRSHELAMAAVLQFVAAEWDEIVGYDFPDGRAVPETPDFYADPLVAIETYFQVQDDENYEIKCEPIHRRLPTAV